MKKLLGTLFMLSAVSVAVAKEVNIKILGTSDVHGRVVPWSYGADVEEIVQALMPKLQPM